MNPRPPYQLWTIKIICFPLNSIWKCQSTVNQSYSYIFANIIRFSTLTFCISYSFLCLIIWSWKIIYSKIRKNLDIFPLKLSDALLPFSKFSQTFLYFTYFCAISSTESFFVIFSRKSSLAILSNTKASRILFLRESPFL